MHFFELHSSVKNPSLGVPNFQTEPPNYQAVHLQFQLVFFYITYKSIVELATAFLMFHFIGKYVINTEGCVHCVLCNYSLATIFILHY